MNAPFKPDIGTPVVKEIFAEAFVSISDLKRNPAAVVTAAQRRQVAILNRNRPVAYVIAPHVWEYLTDLVADLRVEEEARLALEEGDEGNVELDLDRYL